MKIPCEILWHRIWTSNTLYAFVLSPFVQPCRNQDEDWMTDPNGPLLPRLWPLGTGRDDFCAAGVPQGRTLGLVDVFSSPVGFPEPRLNVWAFALPCASSWKWNDESFWKNSSFLETILPGTDQPTEIRLKLLRVLRYYCPEIWLISENKKILH